MTTSAAPASLQLVRKAKIVQSWNLRKGGDHGEEGEQEEAKQEEDE
jgi:hypothetical protein